MRRGASIGGGTLMLLLFAALLLGQDPTQILTGLGGVSGPGGPGPGRPSSSPPPGQGNDEAADFVKVVLGDTEDTWHGIFRQAGATYREPKLVLYNDAVQSACGFGSAAAGPFYCPGDHQVYLDLSFLRELQRMGASGDFAVAYVIAHEIGHHVQNLEGTMNKVQSAQRRMSKRESNAVQVLVELQADCYAGVWAHHAHKQRQILESGDIEEGLQAAAAVGDDRLMKAAGRRVHPESFTHGSSEQRVKWFKTGLKSGSIRACDTFAQANR